MGFKGIVLEKYKTVYFNPLTGKVYDLDMNLVAFGKVNRNTKQLIISDKYVKHKKSN